MISINELVLESRRKAKKKSAFQELEDSLLQLKELNSQMVGEYKNFCKKAINILRDAKRCEICGQLIDEGRFCDSACAYEHELDMQENVIAKNN